MIPPSPEVARQARMRRNALDLSVAALVSVVFLAMLVAALTWQAKTNCDTCECRFSTECD